MPHLSGVCWRVACNVHPRLKLRMHPPYLHVLTLRNLDDPSPGEMEPLPSVEEVPTVPFEIRMCPMCSAPTASPSLEEDRRHGQVFEAETGHRGRKETASPPAA